MTNQASEEQPVSAAGQKERHITELAGSDDRWLSITDASRVARRQEHTVRTWVRDGLLPVHPERVGINKKTRRVRLSDLAKLTPILDIDAAIVTEVGSLDLVSIPRQQQAIKEEHGRLQEAYTQVLERLATLEQEHQQNLSNLHAEFAAHLSRQQGLIDLQREQHETLVELVNTQQGQLTQLRSDFEQTAANLREVLREMNERLGKSLDNAWRALEEHQQQHVHFRSEFLEHLSRDRQATAQRLDAHDAAHTQTQEALEARFLQQEHERDDALQALNSEVAQDLAAMNGRLEDQEQATRRRLEQLTAQAEVAKSAALGGQQRIDKHNTVLQEIRRQLLEEQQARLALAEQVTALTQAKQQRAR